MELQFDNQADIPKGEESDFVEFEQDGKTVFMHSILAESKKAGFRHQGQLSKLTTDFETFKTDINEKRDKATLEANEAQKTALAKQMAELKDSGKTSELHKLELQQAQDKYQSLTDSNEELQKSFTGLQNSLVEKENLNLAMKIAGEYVPSDVVAAFSKLLVLSHIKNVDGKSVFTNASGDAVDNDMGRIFEVLNQDPELKPFAKFPGSKGGYGGKGGSSVGDGKVMSRRDYEAKTPSEKIALMESGTKLID